MSDKIYVFVYGDRYERIQEDYLVSADGNQIIFRGYLYRYYEKYFARAKSTKNPHSYLHRAVYESHYGEIAEGHHIHHKDGDDRNNAIENLESVPGGEHLSRHMRSPERREISRQNIKKASIHSKVWHASEEGREWHRKHGIKTWEKRAGKKIQKTCLLCSKEYEAYWEHSKYCATGCKAKARYASRKDEEQRSCEICEATFKVNRYAKKKTCSQGCSIEAAKRTRLRHRSKR